MNVNLSLINDINILSGGHDDCANFQHIPHNIPHTSRTIAIGDIHGDLEVAVKMLEISKCIESVLNSDDNTITLINKNNENKYYIWTGNDTIIVQVGDQVDRCRPIGDNKCVFKDSTYDDEGSDIKILKFYTDINTLAMKKGGRVISLLGNHEIMNVMGNISYVSYEGLKEFANPVDLSDIINGAKNRKTAFSNNIKIKKKEKLLKGIHSAFINNISLNKYLACTRISGVIIGNLLFVHGGMVKKLAESYHLEDLNKIVQKWLLGKLNDELEAKKLLLTNNERNNESNIKFDFKDRINQLLTSDQSVFWNRILAYIPNNTSIDKCDEYIGNVFKIYDVNGIIIGHTPQMKAGINSVCDNRIWRVDTGASNAFHDFRGEQKIEVLEITYDINDKSIFKILK